jgi:hypothetical protein
MDLRERNALLLLKEFKNIQSNVEDLKSYVDNLLGLNIKKTVKDSLNNSNNLKQTVS